MYKQHGKLFYKNIKKSLDDFLACVPENEWDWYFFEFNGVGVAPHDLGMAEFEEIVQSHHNGFKMSWGELKRFSNLLEDINDCLLVATDEGSPVTYDDLIDGICSGCNVVIKIFDSTDWEIETAFPIKAIEGQGDHC